MRQIEHSRPKSFDRFSQDFRFWLDHRASITHLVILIVGLGLILNVLHSSQPLYVKISAWFLIGGLAFLLMRVDWRFYWANLPSRVLGAGRSVFHEAMITLACAALAVVCFTYGHDYLILLFIGAILALTAAAQGFVILFCFLGSALFESNRRDPLEAVRNQRVYGDSDFANEHSVDHALKGSGAGGNAPTFKD